MSSKFSKILTIVVAFISLIGALLFVNVFLQESESEAQVQAVVPLIEYSAILFYVTVAVTIVLSIVGLVKSPQNLKKTLLGIGVLAVLLIISYSLGDSNVVLDANGNIIEGGEQGSSTNQWVGSLIWLSTILVGIGGVLFVVDLVKGVSKS